LATVKELAILSGKGGTGKTAVAAAFSHLAHCDVGSLDPVVVDADVDAANLELLVGGVRVEGHEFAGASVASIDSERCTGCGICREVCRFDAILVSGDRGEVSLDPLACEGCATCFYQCPEDAIDLLPQVAGQWYSSMTNLGSPLFHARLRPAQENSGKLVTLLKERARAAANEDSRSFMIVDGPPGIACPAIAAVSGADLVLLVAEPTVAGLRDLERALEMAAHFRLKCVVCINKEDLHRGNARKIEGICAARGIRVLGSIPFDDAVLQATLEGRPVTECRPSSPASWALLRLWEDVKAVLKEAGFRPCRAEAG
jgi:MinD superfamily P-loop ATPase